jgi:hypothetical protein
MEETQMSKDDAPATRADVREAITDLKVYLAERETKAMRWFVTIQVAYYFGTLASVWALVLLTHR